MQFLIWGGTALSLVGLVGLGLCILRVTRARRADLTDDQMRDVVRGVMPLNLAALFLSVLGLMAVVIGLMLG